MFLCLIIANLHSYFLWYSFYCFSLARFFKDFFLTLRFIIHVFVFLRPLLLLGELRKNKGSSSSSSSYISSSSSSSFSNFFFFLHLYFPFLLLLLLLLLLCSIVILVRSLSSSSFVHVFSSSVLHSAAPRSVIHEEERKNGRILFLFRYPDIDKRKERDQRLELRNASSSSSSSPSFVLLKKSCIYIDP